MRCSSAGVLPLTACTSFSFVSASWYLPAFIAACAAFKGVPAALLTVCFSAATVGASAPAKLTQATRPTMSPVTRFELIFISKPSPGASVEWCVCLDLAEDVLGGGNFKLARRLDVHALRDPVVDEDRETLAARAHAEAAAVELEAERLSVVTIAIGEHQHLVADVRMLAPRVHHEHVVHGHAGDGVDAFTLDVGCVLHEARQVLGIAGRRERARHGEQHHLLALEELFGGHVLRPVLGHCLQGPRRHAVPGFDRHARDPCSREGESLPLKPTPGGRANSTGWRCARAWGRP